MSKSTDDGNGAGGLPAYTGSTFREVRDQVWSDPYDELPYYTITLGSFYQKMRNSLLGACRFALDNEHDLIPPFQRLVHPLGIALTGTWKITEDNPYSGYFKKGSEGLIVVRCSVLLYETRYPAERGFAFAGKIFPTLDPDEKVKTADFFTIDVLAGTREEYFTNAELSNAPPLGFNLYVFTLFWVVIATFANFIVADLNPIYRPVYPVAGLGLDDGEEVCSPQWMMVRAKPDTPKVSRKDLRDELQVENYPDGELVFEVHVASEKLSGGDKDWQYIGEIVLNESVVSHSCDHRLKFQHPKLEKS